VPVKIEGKRIKKSEKHKPEEKEKFFFVCPFCAEFVTILWMEEKNKPEPAE
jgi:hypothetical protein